jgi:hypothetical protein
MTMFSVPQRLLESSRREDDACRGYKGELVQRAGISRETVVPAPGQAGVIPSPPADSAPTRAAPTLQKVNYRLMKKAQEWLGKGLFLPRQCNRIRVRTMNSCRSPDTSTTGAAMSYPGSGCWAAPCCGGAGLPTGPVLVRFFRGILKQG